MRKWLALLLALCFCSPACAELKKVTKGATDQSVVIRIVDSSTGLPETGVEHDTSGIDLWYRRDAATKTSITEAALASLSAAHADGGIEHIGDGYYRLDLPDAAFATGVNGVMVGGTVTDMVVIGCYVELVEMPLSDSAAFLAQYITKNTGTTSASAVSGSVVQETKDLFADGAPTFADEMDSQGYTAARAALLDNADAAITTRASSAALGTAQADLDIITGANGVNITDNALTAAKIAADAIGESELAANAITSSEVATDAIGASEIASAAITSSKIAASAIGNSQIASDAISSDKFDETTAFPLKSADTGNTTVLRKGSGTVDGTTITAASGGGIIASGIIGDTGNTTTALHLEGLANGDDELNDYLILVYDDSAAEYHSRWILDWADTGDLATVAALPFTPENDTDTYVIQAVRQDVTGGSGLDAAGVRAAVGLASANLDTQLDGVGGGQSELVITTIATLTSQTVFTLTAGSADNDAYNDSVAIITDQSTATQKAVVPISDYTGTSKTVTLAASPAFTISTGDSIAIVASSSFPALSGTGKTNMQTFFNNDGSPSTKTITNVTAPKQIVIEVPD